MFHSTRIKLTVWYLLIIMVVSGMFSGLLYYGATQEMESGFRRAQSRMETGDWLGMLDPKSDPDRVFMHGMNGPDGSALVSHFLFVDDLQKAKDQLFVHLLAINGSVWVLAAITSYYFAGLSLRPIEEALEEQRRFVSDASHELKTPVTALKTSLEVYLQDGKVSSYAKKVLRENLEDVVKLERLIGGLLKLSRTTEQVKRSFERVDLKLVVKQVLKTLKPLIEKKKLKLLYKAGKGPYITKGLEQSLTELVMILVDNSIKYTPEGGEIQVILDRNKRDLVFRIKDDGIGISKKHLSHVFDRFYRADDARTRLDGDGFGLGLALAKKIVDQHGGDISVKSPVLKNAKRTDKRKGTMFVVKFRVC